MILVCLACYIILSALHAIYKLICLALRQYFNSTNQYQEDEIPEALFTYDLSPMAVLITKKGKKWYEFVTSMCALIGGTFTVVGLLSSFLNMVFKSKKI